MKYPVFTDDFIRRAELELGMHCDAVDREILSAYCDGINRAYAAGRAQGRRESDERGAAVVSG